jgi:hypothetical protein
MRAKSNANKRKTTANPLKLLGVTVESAESLCAISVPFNNESREKAITISTGWNDAGALVSFAQRANAASPKGRVFFCTPEGEYDDSVLKKSAVDFNADCVSAIFNR